jgi:hypothetical protein
MVRMDIFTGFSGEVKLSSLTLREGLWEREAVRLGLTLETGVLLSAFCIGAS